MKRITLLFTILCLNTLHGMENEHPHYKGIEKLSSEIQAVLIPVLDTYKNAVRQEEEENTWESYMRVLNEDHKLVKKVTDQLQEVVKTMNQKEFRDLIQVLANTFKCHPNKKTMFLAANFEPVPVAVKYGELSHNLLRKTASNSVTEMLQLINDGADVNFLVGIEDISTPLHEAMKKDHVEAVALLLNNGANPPETIYPKTYIRYAKNTENAEAIMTMLTQAGAEPKK